MARDRNVNDPSTAFPCHFRRRGLRLPQLRIIHKGWTASQRGFAYLGVDYPVINLVKQWQEDAGFQQMVLHFPVESFAHSWFAFAAGFLNQAVKFLRGK